MSLFDLILVQPIFNILLFIYGIIPGHDFGVAIILFTILIRFAMWPLVRKQLRHTKIMQSLQSELQKIKKNCKGNRQLEAQMTMELYRERGVNPFSSIGLLIVQLPIFISLFAVVRLITENHGANIANYAYEPISKIPYISEVIADPDRLNTVLFGVVDLTKSALGGGLYLPLLILAVAAACVQFLQSKQLLPKAKEGRRLRDILKEQAAGKQVDQSEVSAVMSGKMVFMFPALTFFVSIYLAGALVLYLLVTSSVAIFQQSIVLKGDIEEMEKIGESKLKLKQAKKAVVIEEPKKANTKKKSKKS